MKMLILRESTISTFDIVKSKKHMAFDQSFKISGSRNQIFFNLYSDHMIRECELGVQKRLKRSHYNYFVKKDRIGFLWNTASDACVLLNETETEWYNRTEETFLTTDFLLYLYDLGFYVEFDLDEQFRIDLLRKKHAYSYPENGHIDIEILPTQHCNARCFYCFEQNYTSLEMGERTISNVVNYICSRVKPKQEICFIWFGGEPLLGKNAIDKIITQVNNYFGRALRYYSSITTNNSLIDQEMLDSFQGLWRVKDVLTTIDGYREEHNRRKAYVRKELDAYTMTLNNLRRLSEIGITTTCRINLDKDNINQLSLILKDITPLIEYKNFNVQITTLRDKTASVRSRDKYFSSEEYYSFYHIVIPLLYEMGFVRDSLSQLPVRDSSNCIACAVNKVVINSNGKLFKCVQDSLSDDNSVGDCGSGILGNYNYTKWYREIDDLGEKCEHCIFLPCCQGGCKYYRNNPSFDTTPCFRKKFYIDYIIDEIINKYAEEVSLCPIL